MRKYYVIVTYTNGYTKEDVFHSHEYAYSEYNYYKRLMRITDRILSVSYHYVDGATKK